MTRRHSRSLSPADVASKEEGELYPEVKKVKKRARCDEEGKGEEEKEEGMGGGCVFTSWRQAIASSEAGRLIDDIIDNHNRQTIDD